MDCNFNCVNCQCPQIRSEIQIMNFQSTLSWAMLREGLFNQFEASKKFSISKMSSDCIRLAPVLESIANYRHVHLAFLRNLSSFSWLIYAN